MNSDPDNKYSENPRAEYKKINEKTILVSLSGGWLLSSDKTVSKQTLSQISDAGCFKELIIKDAGITGWDSALLVFLRSANALARTAVAEFSVSEMPEGVRRLLNLAASFPANAGTEHTEQVNSFLARVGHNTHTAYQNVKDTASFIGELTSAFFALLLGKARFRMCDFTLVLQEAGPEALPIITLISLLVGMILAFLGSVQLKMFGAEIYIANAVGIGMVREMGALMTGIIMAGRTGAAFAAQIGTMQANEEVDALRTMGFSPVEFLALPRALALIIMMPLLCIYAIVLGIIGGAVVGVLMLDLTPAQYYLQTVNSITIQAVLSGLIKSSVFGVLVSVSGCMQGIRCGRNAAAVGEATTAAVVNAIVYIIVADAVLSIIYTITGF